MSALPKKAKKAPGTQSDGWPLVIYIWMFGLGFLAYVVARIALDAQPHPVHWASGLAGIVLGCGVGWIWYRFKGDVA